MNPLQHKHPTIKSIILTTMFSNPIRIFYFLYLLIFLNLLYESIHYIQQSFNLLNLLDVRIEITNFFLFTIYLQKYPMVTILVNRDVNYVFFCIKSVIFHLIIHYPQNLLPIYLAFTLNCPIFKEKFVKKCIIIIYRLLLLIIIIILLFIFLLLLLQQPQISVNNHIIQPITSKQSLHILITKVLINMLMLNYNIALFNRTISKNFINFLKLLYTNIGEKVTLFPAYMPYQCTLYHFFIPPIYFALLLFLLLFLFY